MLYKFSYYFGINGSNSAFIRIKWSMAMVGAALSSKKDVNKIKRSRLGQVRMRVRAEKAFPK